MTYKPKFRYTNSMVVGLMAIENARATVDAIDLPDYVLFPLRRDASIRSTHFSTKIEGNILGLREVRKVVEGKRNRLGQYEQEVRNYWKALEFLQREVEKKTPISHKFIQQLHRIIEVRGLGRRGKYSPYRAEQNSVKNESGQVVYLPPEPKDVQPLMDDLVEWAESQTTHQLPVPIWAGILSYQFLTIHPFMDGNGRTARALATYLLHREGYGLRGIFSLEDHYVKDINAYYERLQMGLPVNYYYGRNDPDLLPWLYYFTYIVASAFMEAAKYLAQVEGGKLGVEDLLLASLDTRQKRVLGHFRLHNEFINARDLISLFPGKMTINLARNLLRKYADVGFLTCDTKKGRMKMYKLEEKYENALFKPSRKRALESLLVRSFGSFDLMRKKD